MSRQRAQAPSVGGFVIHGNARATLERCLADLRAVCDEVVAVDSGSTDGSADVVAQSGARAVRYPWEGYGAARAAAARALSQHDYLFYLDADEHLGVNAAEAMGRWRQSSPALPHYTVRRRDWVHVGDQRFVFRVETRARLVRRDAATWHPRMVVHEALPRRANAPLGFAVEHSFCTSVEELRGKQASYALLWALRAHSEGRATRSPAGRGLIHVARNALVKGALLRGGRTGWRVARAVAEYHQLKYVYLRRLGRGEWPDLARAMREGRYADVMALVSAWKGT